MVTVAPVVSVPAGKARETRPSGERVTVVVEAVEVASSVPDSAGETTGSTGSACLLSAVVGRPSRACARPSATGGALPTTSATMVSRCNSRHRIPRVCFISDLHALECDTFHGYAGAMDG